MQLYSDFIEFIRHQNQDGIKDLYEKYIRNQEAGIVQKLRNKNLGIDSK
jgi:hypothetical protein